jgi:hypothetical protein
MNKTILVAAVLITGFITTPALADFWVVQNTATKQCSIVEQKPATATATVVGGDGKVCKTHVEAENSMKSEKDCTTERGTAAPRRQAFLMHDRGALVVLLRTSWPS